MTGARPSVASDARRHEHGFALVLALLALLILTTLALTLAATTSLEQQSAVNYRWSQKAFYNAEAGIEVGRYALQRLAWIVPLPSARPPWPAGVRTWLGKPEPRHLPSTGALVRDFEGSACDVFGNGMGFGPVLWDGETTYQDISSVDKHLLDGAFTLWVRRPIITAGDGTLFDYPFSDVLILVSEGVAPAAPPHLGVPRGRVVMEVTLYASAAGITMLPPAFARPEFQSLLMTTPFKVGTSVCQ
jgi:hypothetical protein